MGRHQLAKLTPPVAGVLPADIWTSAALGEHLADNLNGIKSVHAVIRYRLGDLPDAPPVVTPSARPARPSWCGTCDEHIRHQENAEGTLTAARIATRSPAAGERPGHVDVVPPTSAATRAAAKAAITATLAATRMRRCGSAQRRHAAASTTSFGEDSGAIQP